MPAAEEVDARLERELAALRDGAALSPLDDRGVVAARGDDRTSFLQGMLSNDVARLTSGRGTPALLLTEQGRVVAELYALALDDAIWLEIPAAARGRVREALERFVVADDVELDDLALHGLALRGAGAVAALREALPARGTDAAALDDGAHLATEHGGAAIRVVRVRDHGRDGFHLWSSDRAALDALSEALLAAGAQRVGDDALEIDRIRTGWPRDGADYDAHTLAAEVPSFARAVSYRKGCYLGQEVMERVAARGHVNWLFVRLTGGPGSSFSAGAQVKDGEADVGKVTSAARTPGDGTMVALARLRAAVAEPGRRLSVVAAGGDVPVEVATIPIEN